MFFRFAPDREIGGILVINEGYAILALPAPSSCSSEERSSGEASTLKGSRRGRLVSLSASTRMTS